MAIELPDEARQEAVASITSYVQEHLDERIGNLAAGALLDFFLEEVGPSVYNQAVRDVQERLHAQIAELDLDVHEEEFPYWPRLGFKRNSR